MRTAVLFALMGLAAYRATRLLIRDEILEGPRDLLGNWLEEHAHPKLSYLITCPWCVGAYVSAGTVLLVDRYTSIALPVLQGFALSAVVGLLSKADANG